MASPFSIFRKHQKSLMVVLVIGSMIAFTGESLFTSGEQSWPLLGGMLGLGVALIAGFQFGRPMQYAVGGAIVGGLIGFVGPAFVGSDGLQSRLGAFDEERVTELIARRRVANDFVAEVKRRAGGFSFQPAFQLAYGNQNIQRDVVLGEVLRAEADEMGIHIDDAAVNAFIDEETSQQLKESDFIDVRQKVSINNLPISEAQLYDLLRDEIKARVALQTLFPFRNGDSVTPEAYWDLFRRMNVRQQLAFAPVEVDSFLHTVGEPSEAEVQALFEKHRNHVPNLEPGSPGFLQARRMKLAYVEADYAGIEEEIPDATDEEIQTYYDENKDVQFRKVTVPEDPEDGDLDAELKKLEELEKEAFPDDKPETSTPEKADGAGEEAGKTPEKDETGKDPATEAETANEEKKDDGGCEPWQEEEAEGAKEQDAKGAETEKKGDEGSAEQQGTDAPAAPPMLTVPQTDDEPAGADPFAEPPVEYKPLDADLRSKIAVAVKQQKTYAEVLKRIDAAYAEMQRLSNLREDQDLRKLSGAASEDEGMTDTQICQTLKQFAESNGLAYAETPLVTARELFDRQEYPLGSATKPATDFNRRQPNVVQMLFGGGGASLFSPARAELTAIDFDENTNQFAYWVVADVPAHEPTLDEPGMREQVVKAWKREQARPKAEERAKAIAAKVTAELDEENTMSDILKDVTQTGDDTSAKLLVSESPVFSWMRTSSAASPMGMQQEVASLSQIDGIRGITDEFMSYIFTELEPKEVGAVANADRSIYYVVQPLNRFPSDEADEEAALDRFLATKHFQFNSPMPGLVQQQFGEQNYKWLKKLEAKYGLNWDGS